MLKHEEESQFRCDYQIALLILWNEGGSLSAILENRFGWIIKRKEIDSK